MTSDSERTDGQSPLEAGAPDSEAPDSEPPGSQPMELSRAPRILDDLLSDLPGVVYRCRDDPDFTMLGLTGNVEELTGYPPSALLNSSELPFTNLIHPEDRDLVRDTVREAVEPGDSFRVTYRIRTRAGEERWVLEQGQPVLENGERILTGYLQDITGPFAERLAESTARLERARRRVRALELGHRITVLANQEDSFDSALAQAVPVVCECLDVTDGQVVLPEVDEQELPLSEVEWFGADQAAPEFLTAAGSEDRPTGSRIAVPVRSRDQTVAVMAFESARPSGEPNPEIREQLAQVGVQLGRVWEREEFRHRQKRAFEESRETSRFLRQTLASMGEAVFVVGRGGGRTISEANEAAEHIFGYSRDELIGATTEVLHRDQASFERFGREGDGPLRRQGLFRAHFAMRRKDGTVFPAEQTVTLLDPDQGPEGGVVSVLRDVSHQEQLKEQLRHSQRLEGVGRLAGGIAHDFNNLLTVVRGQSDLLHMDLPPDSPLRDEIEVIRDAADRAAWLTSQLLAFSREQVLRPRVVKLNDIVAEMDQLLRRVLGEDIRIETNLGEDLPPIRVDPGQLEQVIMNLAVNARDAMPEGGTLRLATFREEPEAWVDKAVAGTSLGSGPVVRLDVQDTGVGMDERTRERAFDPFFTTKRKGEGTGLGLATVYGTVEQSGGSISVESAPGEGTVFSIRFPAVAGEPEELERPERTSMQVGELSGAILVIEDDAAVRTVARKILGRAGLDVQAVEDAEAGIRLLEEGEPSFGLVLTDLVLPGMGGRELVEVIRGRWPSLSVVVMSGYAEGSPGSRQDLPPDIAFIQKPFTPDALLRLIAGTMTEA